MGHPSYCNQELLDYIAALDAYPKACARFIAADSSGDARSTYLDGRPPSEWQLALSEMSTLKRNIDIYILDLVKGNLIATLVEDTRE